MKHPTLEALGFTEMEAQAYAYLVANPSSTGYRVARGIGKPTANVYRALESLGRKGAVVHDRGATPSFRALSPDDLLVRLEYDFKQKKAAAARELAALRPDEGDERLYTLKSPEQVLARARILLASGRKLVWVDAPAETMTILGAEILDARSRGARVVLRVRRVPGAEQGPVLDDSLRLSADTLVESSAPDPGATFALRMVADARDVLLASLSLDGARVRDALWTRSAFLARSVHDAFAAELFCLRVEQGWSDGLSVDEVEAAFDACRELRDLV